MSIIYYRELVELVREMFPEKFFVQTCNPCVLIVRPNGRDCGVYFKRMRAHAELEHAKEEFEGFISAQNIDW